MTRIRFDGLGHRFDGPGNHMLKISDDLILGIGSEADVDDAVAKQLIESGVADITVIKPPKDTKAAPDEKETK